MKHAGRKQFATNENDVYSQVECGMIFFTHKIYFIEVKQEEQEEVNLLGQEVQKEVNLLGNFIEVKQEEQEEVNLLGFVEESDSENDLFSITSLSSIDFLDPKPSRMLVRKFEELCSIFYVAIAQNNLSIPKIGHSLLRSDISKQDYRKWTEID